MNKLFFYSVILWSGTIFAEPCGEHFISDFEMNKYLNQLVNEGKAIDKDIAYAKKNFMPSALEEEYLRLGHEPLVKFETIEHARFYALNHPMFRVYDFGQISLNQGWTKFQVTMEKSTFYGLNAGWEKRLADGTYARYRMDWDPEVGGHYNLEFIVKGQNGQNKKIKLAVGFNCNGGPCTDQDILNLIKKISQD